MIPSVSDELSIQQVIILLRKTSPIFPQPSYSKIETSVQINNPAYVALLYDKRDKVDKASRLTHFSPVSHFYTP